MAHACMCTNQCKRCGSCCQFPCPCRTQGFVIQTTPTITVPVNIELPAKETTVEPDMTELEEAAIGLLKAMELAGGECANYSPRVQEARGELVAALTRAGLQPQTTTTWVRAS